MLLGLIWVQTSVRSPTYQRYIPRTSRCKNRTSKELNDQSVHERCCQDSSSEQPISALHSNWIPTTFRQFLRIIRRSQRRGNHLGARENNKEVSYSLLGSRLVICGLEHCAMHRVATTKPAGVFNKSLDSHGSLHIALLACQKHHSPPLRPHRDVYNVSKLLEVM